MDKTTKNIIQVINGKTVKFISDTHEYYIDDIKVPSVTQIVSKMLPNQYKNVDPMVLLRAANKGIALHKEIELYELNQKIGITREFKSYLKLKQQYEFEVLENEQLIYIEIDGKPVCAGRLDMIIDSKQEEGLGIADIKRTYNIHHDHLKLQLNLYAIGYEQCYKKEIKYLKCIHLRNYDRHYINVPLDKLQVINIIKTLNE